MRRPDFRIRQDTILTPFSCSTVTVPPRIEEHKIIYAIQTYRNLIYWNNVFNFSSCFKSMGGA